MVRFNKCSNFVECVDCSDLSGAPVAVYKFGLTTEYRATFLAILIEVALWLAMQSIPRYIIQSE